MAALLVHLNPEFSPGGKIPSFCCHGTISLLTEIHHISNFSFCPGVKRCCSEMEEGKLDLTSRCSPYCMFSVRYTDENYRRLLNLSEYNILNNSQMIMQALQTAMQRRRQNTCC